MLSIPRKCSKRYGRYISLSCLSYKLKTLKNLKSGQDFINWGAFSGDFPSIKIKIVVTNFETS